MIGPGGQGGCSVFNCVQPRVETILYDVKRPGREVYQIEYYFCKAHEWTRFDPWQYPEFIVVSERKF